MTTTNHLRIGRDIATKIAADLHRPHAFAFERVGFVFARWVTTDLGMVVIPYDYVPVADENYIEADDVGAKINGAAIRAALQATLDRGEACLHVHAHSPLMPYFGDLDLREQAKLVPSFVATVAGAPHGALLLHGGGMVARIWEAGRLVDVDRVAEVGFPLRVSRRSS